MKLQLVIYVINFHNVAAKERTHKLIIKFHIKTNEFFNID